tara:strand:- start:29 stop:205 length:177 start_codon:yes stop_codon:yes gene_type:complete
MTFKAPLLKKAIKVAQDMGLTVLGYEITPEGGFKISTAQEQLDNAEAALLAWRRGKNG